MSFPGQVEIENGVKALWKYAGTWIPQSNTTGNTASAGVKKPTPSLQSQSIRSFSMPPTAAVFTRLAGLSGAAAVILGAYGAHSFRQSGTPEARETFETGNRYHLIHSVALGFVPLTRNPRITGTLLLGGMLLFSGGCYGYALAQNQLFRRITPVGGVLLILAWLSMIF